MRKYVFEPLHLNFQSHSNLCSGFSFLFLRIFFDFISSRIHIDTTYHKPRDLIKGENSNLEKEYQSLEISNDFKKPFASFFLSHSNKNSREKKGEHTRLTETVEFGYRAFRRRSLLNKFLPPPPLRIPARARCFDNEKPRLFGANHALNTSFLLSPSFCPRNCIPVASFIARIFPSRLPLLLRYSGREIHCEKLPGIKGFLFPHLSQHFVASAPSSNGSPDPGSCCIPNGSSKRMLEEQN